MSHTSQKLALICEAGDSNYALELARLVAPELVHLVEFVCRCEELAIAAREELDLVRHASSRPAHGAGEEVWDDYWDTIEEVESKRNTAHINLGYARRQLWHGRQL